MSAPRDRLRARASLNRLIREFFHARGVLEVETPLLSRAGNTDPNVDSWNALSATATAAEPRRWLRTSPEFALKRLLCDGQGDCYELGRVFRADELGARHSPEFTLLEWYRLGWNDAQLAAETVELIAAALATVGKRARVRRVRYRDLFRSTLGFDPLSADEATLAAALAPLDARGALERDDRLNLLLALAIEPGFARDEITVVSDWPPSQAALARIVADDEGDAVAARFEVFVGPLELANGYHELTDPIEQRQRFERDLARRRVRGQVAPPLDRAFLAALERGLPDAAGVALGVDRLLMALHDEDAIDNVLALPFRLA